MIHILGKTTQDLHLSDARMLVVSVFSLNERKFLHFFFFGGGGGILFYI